MRNLIIICILCISSSIISCTTTKYIEIPKEITRTEYINKIQYDSIEIHDSIDRYTKGDTIYIYKALTKYKYKIKVDTIIKIDSINIERIIALEVEKSIKWYEKLFIYIGVISVVVLLVYLLYILLKIKIYGKYI